MTNLMIKSNDTLSDRVDKLLSDAVKQGDADQAFQICNDLRELQHRAGLALAKVLWTIWKNWKEFGIEEDFFDNSALRSGIHRHTVERYVRIYDMIINSVPNELVDRVQKFNIRDLSPVANAINQGYEIEDKTWDKIANSLDTREIAKIVREDVKGVEPRSNTISLWMDRDGSLWAFNNDQRYFVGSLELSSDDEIIQKAINRIVSNTGITKQ